MDDPIFRARRVETRAALGYLLTLACLIFGCSKSAPRAPTFEESAVPLEQDEAAWSSDGSIAYRDLGVTCVHATGGYNVDSALAGIWVLNPSDGSRMRIVGSGYNPSWSPDGHGIAFESGAQIYLMSRDGGKLRQLTSTGQSFYPAWSPDGSRIAYDSNGGGGSYRIVISDVSGNDLGPVDRDMTGDERMPDWNPATGRIVCLGFPDGAAVSQIIEVDASGHRIMLTDTPEEKLSPRCSPDGKFIAFAARATGDAFQVYIMPSEGGVARRMTSEGGWNPTWSPDGNSIAYTRIREAPSDTTYGTIWETDLRTFQERQLTFRHPRVCQ